MITRSHRRLALASVAALAVTASLSSAALAAAPGGKGDGAQPRTAAKTAQGTAVGLIVQTERETPSKTDVSRIAKAASVDTDAVERAVALPDSGTGNVLVQFDEPLAAEDAQQAVAEVADQTGVVSVEPNWLRTVTTASPVTPNDSFFSELVGIWDDRDAAEVGGGKQWEAGGFSVHAPELWRGTRGSADVTVAVVDSGYTQHPDLDANRVDGYDFVSVYADPAKRDLEDDFPADDEYGGWDDDAADPGDWSVENQCQIEDGPSTAAATSSWHGTHVAGTIAAVDDNGRGVAGVAPNVKYQPVRVTGPCGGNSYDIAFGIVWASGEQIEDLPVNKTPAKVINLSLGGPGQCTDIEQEAVDLARSNGSVVVAAAGNGSNKKSYEALGSPANCKGVVAVTATDDHGQATTYSSLGTKDRRADISAPGGDNPKLGYPQILSTVNEGTTAPTAAGYTEYSGTSMAAPHVAGGAALLASLGYSRSEIESALKKAVRPYPRYGQSSATGKYNCISSSKAKKSEGDCGRGILDLGLVPAFYGSRTIDGAPVVGQTLTLPTQITGVRKNTFSSASISYQWKRDGKSIKKATKKSYKLTRTDAGKSISVQLTVKRSGFKTISFVAEPVTVTAPQ